VQGPGGIGKSSLLRELAGRARRDGRRVVFVDGRDVGPSTSAFEAAAGPGTRRDLQSRPGDRVCARIRGIRRDRAARPGHHRRHIRVKRNDLNGAADKTVATA
jgi:hypothetical protein